MDQHRLWYVRRGERTQGPFPETLVCRYIALGRVVDQDELSPDGVSWQRLEELPELRQIADALVQAQTKSSAGDVDWHEERVKAAKRWMDDRKSPDPRKVAAEAAGVVQERRAGSDRREAPEAVENLAYRESRAGFESWMRSRRQHYGIAIALILVLLAGVLAAALLVQPVHPIKVGLNLHPADCTRAAGKGVNWSRCSKEGELLVGADLRVAELVGTNLTGANLKYADLTQANLAQANLAGADLTGARLGGAIWVDGRACAAESIGACR